jgi:hypothetical protein
MSGASSVVVSRRGSAEIVRLVSLYRVSGMKRAEFCRNHGLSLSTLDRHLKKQQHQPYRTGEDDGKLGRLVEVELSTGTVPVAAVERPGILTVLLSKGRRVEVDRGFDAGTLAQLITVLERL